MGEKLFEKNRLIDNRVFVTFLVVFYPICMTLLFVVFFQVGETLDVNIFSSGVQLIIQVLATMLPPIALVLYASHKSGGLRYLLSLVFLIVYVPVYIWVCMVSYLMFSCALFNACEVP